MPSFSSSDKGNVIPSVELVFAQLNTCVVHVCYCLQHLVMAPPPLLRAFGQRLKMYFKEPGKVGMQECWLDTSSAGWLSLGEFHCLEQKLRSRRF